MTSRGFLWVLRFPLPIKLTATDIFEVLLKVALSTITLTLKHLILISVSIVSQEPQPTLEPQPLPLFGDRYSGIMEDISVSFLK